jgi:hypothetical protein
MVGNWEPVQQSNRPSHHHLSAQCKPQHSGKYKDHQMLETSVVIMESVAAEATNVINALQLFDAPCIANQ